MIRKIVLGLLLSLPVFAFQTEEMLPWVTNNSTFRGTIVVNNLNDHDVEVILVATRNDGSEQGVIRTVPALGQIVESAGSMFSQLGDGAGYCVLLTTNSDNVSGGFIVSATGSASGSSPAQTDGVQVNDASPYLLFNYLPIGNGGFSAPVIVNMGDADANVVFHAYRDRSRVGSSAAITVSPGKPYAALTTDLFEGLSGNVFVLAESDQPLIGTAFTFNEQREPSMVNARTVNTLPSTEPSVSQQVLVLNGNVVTGINHFMGNSILDFGGGIGTFGFPTVGAYQAESELTLDLDPTMLNDPSSVILAAGAGLVPTQSDTFNANVPLHLIPAVVGTLGFGFSRAALAGMLGAQQMDPTIAEPYGPVTLEQWLKANGKLNVRCLGDGTAEVTIQIEGLLPHRLYSLWASFDNNGALQTVAFGGLPNTLTTDNAGKAIVKRVINFCPMDRKEGELELLLIDVVLHSDHMVYGAIPTASQPGKDAHAHLGFFFGGELINP